METRMLTQLPILSRFVRERWSVPKMLVTLHPESAVKMVLLTPPGSRDPEIPSLTAKKQQN